MWVAEQSGAIWKCVVFRLRDRRGPGVGEGGQVRLMKFPDKLEGGGGGGGGELNPLRDEIG